jgi:hypothetical protein
MAMGKATQGDGVLGIGQGAGRRKLGAALLALAASTLAARGAGALPRAFRRALAEANRLLQPLGLRVSDSGGRNEVITVSALARTGKEVDFVVINPPEPDQPLLKASFLNDVALFETFELVERESAPAVRTLADGPFVVFERFDPTESRVTPVLKTSVEGDVATFEHFHPGSGAIDPCWRSVVDEDEAGMVITASHININAGRVDNPDFQVTIDERRATATASITASVEPGTDFTVVVGDRRWTLVNGALVEAR